MEQQVQIDDLPDTVLLQIFKCLSKSQRCEVARACKRWQRIAYDSSLWECTDLRRFRHRLDEIKIVKLIRSRMEPLLRKINLGGFTLSPKVFQILTKHCRRLKELCLKSVTFVGNFADCEESFPTNLQKLDIRYSSGHSTAFRKIAQSLRSTTCLGVSNELLVSLPLPMDVRDMFVQLAELRVLEFSYCIELTDEMVGFIAEFCTNLESLRLRRCNHICGTTLTDLIDSCSLLTSLVLDNTSLTDSAIQAVHWERSIIHEIDLSWCRHLTQVGLKFMLTRLRCLKNLRLCCCGYGHAITDDVLQEMKRSNRKCLKVLDMSYSWDVTDKALGEFVKECPSLLYLRIYHCRIVTPAFMDLIPADSQVLVVANFPQERDGLITTRDGFRRCVSTAPLFLTALNLDNEMNQD